MSVAFGLVMFGALLIIAGWQDKSLAALARGDNTTPKGAVLAGGGSSSSSATPAPATDAGTGAGGPTTGAGSGATGSPAPTVGSGGAW